uniref:Peptidase S1 domain-containing protein n=1 Tax=Trichuris muris TaxID=70415 RepID=A0A5S6QJH6_TRIMR
MFCAGSKTENIGICLGASGGPLVCEGGVKFTLYGVLSFTDGFLCSDIYDPAVFTEVSASLPWLKQTALALEW